MENGPRDNTAVVVIDVWVDVSPSVELRNTRQLWCYDDPTPQSVHE